MNLQEQFEDAVKRAKNLPNQSNNTLLEIYSLYKQATEGDVKGERPSMFDFKGVAKYDAWLSKKGMSKEEAMQKYIDLISKLESN
ncbi:MAG: acyl-CoA-binding protein [Candidatus Sericytochromatia bacterium]|nr:MAG: acyl-CoA-binding protein [Candidatus Sericytochromatia bacterium]